MLFPKPFAIDILDSGTVGRSVVQSETQMNALSAIGASGLTYHPAKYGTCGPAATGAQNRAAIQAAIDAATADAGGFGVVELPAGELDVDKASSAEPGSPGNDYCLRGKSNVRLIGRGTTLRLADNQLVHTPSVRQLAILSLNTISTGESLTNFGVKGITFDGNAANQNGYSTYDQLGATMGIRATPGLTGDTDELISDLWFEDIICKDFFGNASNFGSGASEFIERFYQRNITSYRCGEGWQLIRCRYVWSENITYVDDNPDALLGVGTGFVTVGDPHEFSYCEDVNGVGVNVYAIGTVGSGINSGGGSGLDLFNSVRVQLGQINIYWNNGIECGSTIVGCDKVQLSHVRLRCPTLAAASSATIGIDTCPNLTLEDCKIEGYGAPMRLRAGTRSTAGTGCSVDATDLSIVGGGTNDSAAIVVGSGGQLRTTNLRISDMGAAVRGVRVSYDASGVHADTRLEITGGRIASTGAAIAIDGGGTSFSPKGTIRGLDASDAFSGAWPFINVNNGTFDAMEINNVQPKTALLSGVYYAGAEVITANGNVTALANGSKNQRLLLEVPAVADPFTLLGTFSFGHTSAATASRINLRPYLITSPFENGAGVFLRRNDAGVYDETGRTYPVHGNTQIVQTFTAPVTVGTTYNATPSTVRMTQYGRLQKFRVRFSNTSAARTAGTITVVLWKDAGSLGTVLTINGTNTTGHASDLTVRLGTPFTPSTVFRYEITASGDFTNSGGATDLVLEMVYET